MAMEQVRAQVKAQVPETGKVLVLETELVQVLVLVRDSVLAAVMAWDPVWGLGPFLAMELVQARETDRVTDQELEWESAGCRCDRPVHHP